jgi:hypothetical protein
MSGTGCAKAIANAAQHRRRTANPAKASETLRERVLSRAVHDRAPASERRQARHGPCWRKIPGEGQPWQN